MQQGAWSAQERLLEPCALKMCKDPSGEDQDLKPPIGHRGREPLGSSPLCVHLDLAEGHGRLSSAWLSLGLFYQATVFIKRQENEARQSLQPAGQVLEPDRVEWRLEEK